MKLLLSSFIALFFLIFSFEGKSQNWIFKDYKAIVPPDFNPKKDFLLIETFPVSAKSNAKMKEWLAKNYSGAFAIVDKQIIYGKDNPYSDTSVYKYAFVWGSWNTTFQGNFTYRDPNGNFFNRATNTSYPTTKKYNNYGDKSYITFFNSIMKNY
jgi:hypothetical protein